MHPLLEHIYGTDRAPRKRYISYTWSYTEYIIHSTATDRRCAMSHSNTPDVKKNGTSDYTVLLFKLCIYTDKHHTEEQYSQTERTKPWKHLIFFTDLRYPEWSHRQSGFLAWWGCKVDSCSVCTDLYYARGAQGVLPIKVGGVASQLDLPSLTHLSVTGCGRLQLGVPHFTTSVDYCKWLTIDPTFFGRIFSTEKLSWP